MKTPSTSWLLVVFLSSCGGEVSSPLSATNAPVDNITSESANGTMIPPATAIIDSNGTTWTVSDGHTYQNGVADGGGDVATMVYMNGAIYVGTNSYGWWVWDGGWRQLLESPTGSAIPSANQIIDSAGTLWTVNDTRSFENGLLDNGGNIEKLFYVDRLIYAKTYNYGVWVHASDWQYLGESPSGTMIPAVDRIIDGNGTLWTVHDRLSFENGVADNGGDIKELLYLNGVIYANTYSYGWWSHVGTWQQTQDPTGHMPPPPADETVGPRYPVGPQASVACSGVTLNPGDNIQSFVDAYGAGTVFCLNPGTYVQQAVTPKASDQFIGYAGAIMDGQNVTWTAFGGSADGVVIKNLVITRYANGLQFGSIQDSGSNWLIQNNDISFSAGAGVGIDDVVGTKLIANYIHHNNQEGYNAHGTNVVFDSNEIAFNNYLRQVSWGWEAGGGKAAFTKNLLVTHNYSHDNYGPGLWTDIDNIDVTYTYNLVENNSTGIYQEIGYNALIAHNVTRHNADPTCAGWLWCSEIMISASGGVDGGQIEIFDNSVASILDGKGNGISLAQQNRGVGSHGPYIVQNVWVHHNTIDLSAGGYTGVVEDVYDPVTQTYDSAIYTSRNNRYDYNTYILGAAQYPFSYWDTWGDFAFWQSAGMDVHGSARR